MPWLELWHKFISFPRKQILLGEVLRKERDRKEEREGGREEEKEKDRERVCNVRTALTRTAQQCSH